MTGRLQGKVAIVTGAARGLGRAFAISYAQEGADVATVDLNDCSDTCAEIEAMGVKAIDIRCDVSSEAEVEEMVRRVVAEAGKIDILVNNAAIYHIVPLFELSYSVWKRTLAVNLDSVFLCTKAVLPHMQRQSFGRIINIGSDHIFIGMSGYADYTAAKCGVKGLTMCAAAEFGNSGITVNSISPGMVVTEGLAELTSPDTVQMALDRCVEQQAIKRNVVPNDLVGAAVFFASDESAFITGQTLCVNGGYLKH